MKLLPIVSPASPAPHEPSGSRAEASGGSGPSKEASALVEDAGVSARLKPLIVAAISTVFDPEIPVNIYEMGLVYGIVVDAAGRVAIRMTLTSPACPSAQFLPVEVQHKVAAVPGVAEVKVDVVWEPPWDRDRMSDAAKIQLGIF